MKTKSIEEESVYIVEKHLQDPIGARVRVSMIQKLGKVEI
jgi:hypothetical protein